MQCELQSKHGTGGSPEVGDPAVRNDAYWRPGWVPIMDADGAGGLVLDLDPASGGAASQVFKWSFGGSPAPRVLARSFGEWLAVLAEMLVKRQFGLDEFGSIWLGGVPSAAASKSNCTLSAVSVATSEVVSRKSAGNETIRAKRRILLIHSVF
jgi:hypothetical protein